MQSIEDIVYSAISHGCKDELYREVGKIQKEKGSPPNLLDVYALAYERVVTRV